MKTIKTLMITLMMCLTTIMSFGQQIKHSDLLTTERGEFTSYLASDGAIYKVGDRIKIGVPSSNKTFAFITEGDGLMIPFKNLTAASSGQETEIKKIWVVGNKRVGYSVSFRTKGSTGLSNYTIQFENALSTGEVKGFGMTSDDALAELKKAKDKLDLGLITAQNQEVKEIKSLQISDSSKSNDQNVKLSDFENVIKITSMMDKVYWSLGVNYQKLENKPSKPKEVISDIETFISSSEEDKSGMRPYLIKYKEPIDSVFNSMNLIGNSLGEFVYSKKSLPPLRICMYNDTSKIFFITGIAIQDVYNTLKLTSRQRASRIITSYLIPSLKALKPMLNKEYEYVGLGAVFASKDFSNNSVLSTKEEYILFVVTAKKAMDFINGKITEDELVEFADIISSDRDMSLAATKKIKITLE